MIPNSRITAISRYGEGAPMPAGLAMLVAFELDGAPYQALNGGAPSQCGWLRDRFGATLERAARGEA